MKLVIYARYSSHSQTEQSIEGQLIACYDYAKNNGHTVVGLFSFFNLCFFHKACLLL